MRRLESLKTVALLLVVLSGFGLRAVSLGARDINYDEATHAIYTLHNPFPFLILPVEKPPLYAYWLKLSTQICGFNAIGIRAPSLIFGVLLAALGIVATRGHPFGARLLVVSLLATTPCLVGYSRLALLDISVALFLTSALLCYIRNRPWLGLLLSTGVVFTKGEIWILLVGAGILLCELYLKRTIRAVWRTATSTLFLYTWILPVCLYYLYGSAYYLASSSHWFPFPTPPVLTVLFTAGASILLSWRIAQTPRKITLESCVFALGLAVSTSLCLLQFIHPIGPAQDTLGTQLGLATTIYANVATAFQVCGPIVTGLKALSLFSCVYHRNKNRDPYLSPAFAALTFLAFFVFAAPVAGARWQLAEHPYYLVPMVALVCLVPIHLYQYIPGRVLAILGVAVLGFGAASSINTVFLESQTPISSKFLAYSPYGVNNHIDNIRHASEWVQKHIPSDESIASSAGRIMQIYLPSRDMLSKGRDYLFHFNATQLHAVDWVVMDDLYVPDPDTLRDMDGLTLTDVLASRELYASFSGRPNVEVYGPVKRH